MTKVLTRLLATIRVVPLNKGLLVALGAALVVVAGVAAWITLLYQRIDDMQAALDELHRSAGQLEVVLQDVNLDRDRLRQRVQEQSEAIEALRSASERLRAQAAQRARMVLEVPTPPAGTGVDSMNDWWQANVVQ